ncbi:MAG: winged helix-turn-helix transcriptional regulator [Burkholderiales bacterium]|nr:winged helix-turn-helix transcriptional regulator [Burkholderiales bacterium]
MSPPRRSFTPLDQTTTHRLHTLTKITDRISQAAYLDDAGIPISEGRCLAAIGAFSPLSVNELACQSNLNKSQASRAVQALVDKGLVLKTTRASDARGVVLSLTPLGRSTWQRVMAVVERRNAEIESCFSAAESRQFHALLARLVEHARGAAGTLDDTGE